jgi:putative phosphoribosyl transferase
MPLPEDEQGFEDRRDAGRRLGPKLVHYVGESDLLVLALPPGGVPVAYEVAEALAAPLDAFLVRRLGVPGHDEIAMGVIASGGIRVLNDDVIRALRLDEDAVGAVAAREWRILHERELSYRDERSRPGIQGCTVILVDDGSATGASLRAAVQALNEERPKRLIVAVPVASPETCDEIRTEVDEIVCVLTPPAFRGVARWYESFLQITDEEIRELLGRTMRRAQPGGKGSGARALLLLLATTLLFACQPNQNPTPTPVPRVPTPKPEPNREPESPGKPHAISDTRSQTLIEDISTQTRMAGERRVAVSPA